MFLQKPMLGTQIDRSDSLNNPVLDHPVLDLLMNEGHGDRVNDLSGWGNHGTLYGFDFPPTRTSGWNPGLDGVALTFDGTDDNINCGAAASLDLLGAFTIDILVYLLDNYQIPIITKFSGSTDTGYGLATGSDDKMLFLIMNGGWAEKQQVVGSVAPLNTWVRYTATADGEYMILYKNGVEVGRTAQTYNPISTSTDLKIGGGGIWSDHYLNGGVSTSRILPRAMSEFEIMQTQIDPYGVYLQ